MFCTDGYLKTQTDNQLVVDTSRGAHIDINVSLTAMEHSMLQGSTAGWQADRVADARRFLQCHATQHADMIDGKRLNPMCCAHVCRAACSCLIFRAGSPRYMHHALC
jgi:hypothetical protein